MHLLGVLSRRLRRFKDVNDGFGHEIGDRVLAWLGRMLEDHTRTADAPFRISGDEFAVFFPRTTAGIAGPVAVRVVGLVSDARPPLDFDLRVTLSGGFSSCPVHGTTPEDLFQAADRALGDAKSEGRNRVREPGGGTLEEAAAV